MNAPARIIAPWTNKRLPSKDAQTTHLVTYKQPRSRDKAADSFGAEWSFTYTEEQCVRDIIDGQHEFLDEVYAANLTDGTFRCASEDIARAIPNYIALQQIDPDCVSHEAHKLCSRFGLWVE